MLNQPIANTSSSHGISNLFSTLPTNPKGRFYTLRLSRNDDGFGFSLSTPESGNSERKIASVKSDSPASRQG